LCSESMPEPKADRYRLVRLTISDTATSELLSEYLLELGAVSVSLEAHNSAHGKRPTGDAALAAETWARPHWTITDVVAMVPQEIRTEALLQAAATVFPEVMEVPVVEQPVDSSRDWVRAVRESFQPLLIGERLLVRFPWNTEVSVRSLLDGDGKERVQLTIEPGAAFGTGEHPTTQLCARWLELHVQPGSRVLDYGSGSGILVMYACKLGADPARSVGIDIDEEAIAVAKRDAVRNQLDGLVFATPDEAEHLLQEQRFDLLVSNILAPTLQELAPRFCSLVRTGGRIALSGMLAAHTAAVWASYAADFHLEESFVQDEWVLVSGIRRR
jgi:ribosomal protein L11 methyltransferase